MTNLYDSAVQQRVFRLDGRTRVIAVYRPYQWEPLAKAIALTPASVQHLRADGVFELELRRRLTRARIPIGWLRRHFSEN